MNQVPLEERYPKVAVVADDRRLTLRLLAPHDRDTIIQFAERLPKDDLLFLPEDIHDPATVDEWIQAAETGKSFTILALEDDRLAGYASLRHSTTTWTRHLGEIRLLTAPEYRGKGLGRILAVEMFSAGRALGLTKLSAQMTTDQRAAKATFEQFGFRPVATLKDFVIAGDGRTRDLLVMAYDLNRSEAKSA